MSPTSAEKGTDLIRCHLQREGEFDAEDFKQAIWEITQNLTAACRQRGLRIQVYARGRDFADESDCPACQDPRNATHAPWCPNG